MSFLARLTAAVLCLGALVAIGSGQPDWASALGLDPQAWLELGRQKARSAQLDEHRRVAEVRTRQKEQVIDALIAGQETLPGAARKILKVSDPDFLTCYLPTMGIAGDSEEERLYRVLIYWAQGRLAKRPAEAARVNARLGDELERHLNATASGGVPLLRLLR